MRLRRTPLPIFAFLASVVLFAGVATAHGVTTRFDAPIPLTLLFGGAGATVALTALFLSATVERTPTGMRRISVLSSGTVAALRLTARVAFLAIFLLVLAVGSVGPANARDNPATLFTWSVWLKGIGLLAVLFGSPWRTLAPWRTIYDGLSKLEGKQLALFDYPDQLGDWPALVGFLALVGIVENLTRIPDSPRLTAVLLAGYALIMLFGGVLFGTTWFERADPLAVLYRLFGRVAPLKIDGSGIDLRPPWRGCLPRVRSLSLAGFVVASVYTVSFDGFTETPEYQTILFWARDVTGLGSVVSVPLYLGGFLAFLAVFALVAMVTQRISGSAKRGGTRESWREMALALAPTVVPIAVAYEVAHNYPFVLQQLSRLLTVLGGTEIELLGWLSLPAFWASQVLLIVLGHLVAVVAAHYVALEHTNRVASVGRTHLPLTALMVGYTVLSLWIISRPVAT
ncbi:hypothetical protein SAMN05421858_4056 [Haladaptatus litoreus]|uniref:Uncharacterized protein n=2 Tax=Haladaptatus litoreus TaxID=553468 RepID=A0A1N7E664_9EURY|nr:hypothetical protein SAMN05421858_4056 [Haladaptatus litoreus]